MSKPSLKVDLTEGEISFQGDLLQLSAEIGYIVHDIYNSLHVRSLHEAELFRTLIAELFAPGSRVWKVEDMPGKVSVIIATKKGDPA